MRTRRSIGLAVALAMSGVVAFSACGAESVESTATPGASGPPNTAGPWATVPNSGVHELDIFLVVKPIAAGEPAAAALARGAIRSDRVEQRYRPVTAVNTVEEIEHKQAWVELAPGTVVVNGLFVFDDGTFPVPVVAPPPTVADPPATPQPDGSVPVLAVIREIPRGMTGRAAHAAGLLAPVGVPRHTYPATAFTSADAIGDRVAVMDLAPGTVLFDGLFVPSL